MNCSDGVLSDVSGIAWDAALLLAGYLHGTEEGRQLCFGACFGEDLDGDCVCAGGILELGAGLGIVGNSAAAAALSVRASTINWEYVENGNSYNNLSDDFDLGVEEKLIQSNVDKIPAARRRVILTDRNDEIIMRHLRRNVCTNLHKVSAYTNQRFLENESNDYASWTKTTTLHATIGELNISVQPCDWLEISKFGRMYTKLEGEDKATYSYHDEKLCEHCPQGTFDLILGSALVYTPELAYACAETLYYYLMGLGNGSDQRSWKKAYNRKAIIVQLPDRPGFSTHFLPRCCDLGLDVTCHDLSEELIESVQMGWGRGIPSANDYQMYFITPRLLETIIQKDEYLCKVVKQE